MSLALSLLMTCSACANLGSKSYTSKQAVSLPPAPVFLAPVKVPEVKAGDDARLDLAKTNAALKVANARLDASRQIYNAMRQRYGGAKLK